MKSPFRPLFVLSAVLSLAGCDKPTPPDAVAPAAAEADNQLAEARDALQRQALEIETKTALMDKQLAEMEQSLKDRDNAELRGSLDTLKRQNDELRVQADAARQQSNAMTQRIAVTPPRSVAPQPMALPDYSLFYEGLAPYGRWFEVNGYGYCWRPTITVTGWRPYVDGCWVWSSLGWAWQTNEPFGWATYHYGRWVNLASHGWVWVPGSEWAPAWVAWRQSRDCVGWAPLPPEQGVCSGVYRDCDSRYGLGPTSYVFINTTQFVSPTYINVCAPVTQRTTIFQHSVNVTQLVPRSGHKHAFVQQGGPPRAQMEQACGRTVPQRQVHTMHADQLPTQQHHGRRDAAAPVAMVELPTIAPGGHMRRPDVKEHIQHPARVGGFEGVPQRVATEIRETIAREKETAVVQQQPGQQHPLHGRAPHHPSRHPGEAPAVVNGVPGLSNAPSQETVHPAIPAEKPVTAGAAASEQTAVVQQQPGHGGMPHGSPRHPHEAPPSGNVAPMTNAPAQETLRPGVTAEPGSGVAQEHRHRTQPAVGAQPGPGMSPESKAVENSTLITAPSTPLAPAAMPLTVENPKAAEPFAPAVLTAAPAALPQPPAETSAAQQPAAAEKMAAEQAAANATAEAEKAHLRAGREQGHAGMEQRQQKEMQERGMAEKRAAEQAAANAEAEKSRMQAAAAQQEALTAQQQRMAADQAAAETEKARQQAAAQQQRAAAERMAADQAAAETEKARQQAAAQQQQEMAAQQQRAAAERMAAEQAAAAEAERARQQTEAAAMQRQQEEAARRAAEEQQMRAQQETERRAQEMAQRQAEEQARRQQEAEMQRAQEQARRAAEEQQMRAQQEAERRAQEMAQRQAEESARRQQEAEMQRAQEQARRAAEEQQMRAQQEAAQRAQEMAQRQAEEQARRAQEEAQRAAAEAAQRAAAEAARNQPQPAPPGQ